MPCSRSNFMLSNAYNKDDRGAGMVREKLPRIPLEFATVHRLARHRNIAPADRSSESHFHGAQPNPAMAGVLKAAVSDLCEQSAHVQLTSEGCSSADYVST